jgi:hypothetical protein
MAGTFTLTSDAYQGRYMQLTCQQVPDPATNRSTINWTLSVLGGESSYYQTGPTTVTIAGRQVYYCKQMAWDTKVFPAARGSTSGSLVVDHDAYGNTTIAVSMSTSIYTGVVKGYNGNWSLDGLPRQAAITAVANFTDVDNPSISFSNPGGHRIDVWLEPNPVGEHLCVRTNIPNTGSYTWNLTDAERDALRNKCAGKSCTIRFGLYSYVGGTEYADYRDMTYTMTENAATIPGVTLAVSPNNGSLPSAFNGVYIQGKSRLNVTISATGKYGTGIAGYSGWVEGKGYHASSFVTDALQNYGEVTVAGYAMDNRGFTGNAAQNISVFAYAKPMVIPLGSENAILCYRSDGNGVRTGSSTSVWIKAARFYYKVPAGGSQKNFCALQWRRKLSTEDWNDGVHLWSDLLEKSNGATDEYSGLLSGVVFELTKAYTIQIRAIDDLGEADTKTLEVSTRDVALHLGKGGKNVSIGSFCDYSEDYTFHTAWKMVCDEDVEIGGELRPASIGRISDYLGLDLNDLRHQTGYYISIAAPTEAAGCKNFPVELTGMLTVVGFGDFTYQTYSTYDGKMYARSYYTEIGWTPWKQIQMV